MRRERKKQQVSPLRFAPVEMTKSWCFASVGMTKCFCWQLTTDNWQPTTASGDQLRAACVYISEQTGSDSPHNSSGKWRRLYNFYWLVSRRILNGSASFWFRAKV